MDQGLDPLILRRWGRSVSVAFEDPHCRRTIPLRSQKHFPDSKVALPETLPLLMRHVRVEDLIRNRVGIALERADETAEGFKLGERVDVAHGAHRAIDLFPVFGSWLGHGADLRSMLRIGAVAFRQPPPFLAHPA